MKPGNGVCHVGRVSREFAYESGRDFGFGGGVVADDEPQAGFAHVDFVQGSQTLQDFFAGTDDEHGLPDGDDVAGVKGSEPDGLAIEFRSVGAFGVDEDDLVVVFLDFTVVPADPFVVQGDFVAGFPSDTGGEFDVVKGQPFVGAIQYSERNVGK